jgi:hypothetical protein
MLAMVPLTAGMEQFLKLMGVNADNPEEARRELAEKAGEVGPVRLHFLLGNGSIVLVQSQ